MARTDHQTTGVVKADGTLTLSASPTSRQNWSVDSISINAPNVGGVAVGRIYRGRSGSELSQFVSFFIATSDTVEGVPVQVPNGYAISAHWTGAVVGATAEVTFWYDDGEG